jgi:hypothetical protein
MTNNKPYIIALQDEKLLALINSVIDRTGQPGIPPKSMVSPTFVLDISQSILQIISLSAPLTVSTKRQSALIEFLNFLDIYTIPDLHLAALKAKEKFTSSPSI